MVRGGKGPVVPRGVEPLQPTPEGLDCVVVDPAELGVVRQRVPAPHVAADVDEVAEPLADLVFRFRRGRDRRQVWSIAGVGLALVAGQPQPSLTLEKLGDAADRAACSARLRFADEATAPEALRRRRPAVRPRSGAALVRRIAVDSDSCSVRRSRPYREPHDRDI